MLSTLLLAALGLASCYQQPAVLLRQNRVARSSSPAMGVESIPGVSVECGGKVWDPLG